MATIFNIIMLILQGALALGSFALAFLERGMLPKLLYVLAALLLAPVMPLRRGVEGRFHLKSFVLPAAGLAILIIAVMITPIH